MFSTLFAAQRDRCAPRSRIQPKLEALEDRLVPSGYSMTDLGVPSGYSSVTPYAMNNAGEIVGVATTQGLALGEVEIYSNGQWAPLAQVPASGFFPIQINQNGEVLGVVPAIGQTPLELYTSTTGQFVFFPPPPGYFYFSDPVSIDDAGDVFAEVANPTTGDGGAGLFVNSQGQGTWTRLPLLPNGIAPVVMNITDKGQLIATEGVAGLSSYHVYVSTPDHANPWRDLGTPNGARLLSAALNDNGQVFALTQGHSFILSNNQWTDIGTPPGFPVVKPQSFDNAGQLIANASVTASSTPQPFLYSNGQWINLNKLLPSGSSVKLTRADAFNYNGQIVATGANGHAYLLTPQSSTPPPPGHGGPGGPGGSGGAGASTPIPFIQALITLYIDGFEKIFHDTPMIEQSIQENLPWATFGGFDLGSFIILEGEMAALGIMHGK